MNVSSAQHIMTKYSSIKSGQNNNSKDNAVQASETSTKDSVSISAQARAASGRTISGQVQAANVQTTWADKPLSRFTFGALAFTNRAWQGEQTASEAATGYKYYTEPGRISKETDQNLAGERDALGKKIDDALKKAGIELNKDDNLKFSVGKDGKVAVDANGLSAKNKNNAKAIEDALNGSPGLAKDLYLNSAAQSLNNGQKRAENNNYTVGSGSASEAAAQRASVDDWMRSTFGFGIDELEAEGWGSEEGAKGANSQALSDYTYGELGATEGTSLLQTINDTIANSKKFGDAGKEYQASFSFRNGTLTDTKAASGTAKTDAAATEEAAATADALVAKKDEIATGAKQEDSAKVDTAVADFKSMIMSALGFKGQSFGMSFANGMFGVGNTSLLNSNDRNAVSSIVDMLNTNTGSKDLTQSAQTLRNLLSSKSMNIDF